MDPAKCWRDLQKGLESRDAEMVADMCDCLLYWLEGGGELPRAVRYADFTPTALRHYLTDLRTVAEWSAANRQDGLARESVRAADIRMTPDEIREYILHVLEKIKVRELTEAERSELQGRMDGSYGEYLHHTNRQPPAELGGEGG